MLQEVVMHTFYICVSHRTNMPLLPDDRCRNKITHEDNFYEDSQHWCSFNYFRIPRIHFEYYNTRIKQHATLFVNRFNIATIDNNSSCFNRSMEYTCISWSNKSKYLSTGDKSRLYLPVDIVHHFIDVPSGVLCSFDNEWFTCRLWYNALVGLPWGLIAKRRG